MRKAVLLTACSCLLTTSALFAATPASTPTGSTGASAATLLTQLSTAFSGGNVVHQVQLTGTANWHVGNLEDTGTATLSAATNGSSELQLSLSASGKRTETQTGQGSDLTCTWAGDDAATHRTRRSTVKPPVASANRPVPPVIVLISTIRLRPGIPATGSPSPTMVVVIISPFFAVNSADPVEDPAGRLTVTL